MRTLYCYLSLPPGSGHLQRAIEEKLASIQAFPIEVLAPPSYTIDSARTAIGPWINGADIVIADVSSTDPGGLSRNVLFELGYASGSGKQQILIQDITSERPTDSFLGLDRTTHTYNPDDLRPFLEELTQVVLNAYIRLQVEAKADFGITSNAANSFTERPDLLSNIANAKRRIWILTTSLHSLSPELASQIVAALNDSARPDLTLQVCTQDPYSLFVAERAAQLALPESVYRHDLHTSLLALRDMLTRCNPNRWDVRMYDTFPTQVAYGVDDQVFVSMVSIVQSRAPIPFVVAGTHASPYLDHFQFLYTRAKSVRDQYRLYDTETPPEQVGVDIGRATDELLAFLKKKPDYLYQISPRAFEELVAEILASFGWDVQLTAPTRDGGYDIFAVTKNIAGLTTSWIVECKRYAPDRKVGINVARSLYGVKTDLRVANALLATTSSFSKGVTDFAASRYDFALRDFEGILEWINHYRPHPGGRLYVKDKKLIVPHVVGDAGLGG